jgi:hypothetical protein
MRTFVCTALLIAFALLSAPASHAQGFLKKIKDKANQVADKAVDNAVNKTVEDKTGVPMGTNQSSGSSGQSSSSSSSGKPTNKTGEGLKNATPPDVNAQILEAEKAHDAGSFSDARYAIQQALLGVEIQIGREILTSLPATVNGLNKDTTQDKVAATQWGWSNITIQRVYTKTPDQQLTVAIGNNSFYSGLVNMYFNNAYVQANAEQQNVKQVKVKSYRAIIQFDDSKGYTLLIPIGQSSIISLECINFANEQDVMNAANTFDIDGIKKMLGEQ